ncbi:MAG: hypothetical protein GY821_17155, partial [Gammaproteobacteria bacterium]|nr:hypothetical protein [Gammaproteobacteria bacterium]
SVAHKAGKLKFFGQYADLVDARTFAAYLEPHRKTEWVIYYGATIKLRTQRQSG